MRIGFRVPSYSFKITHLDIANHQDVPVFFANLYETSKNKKVTLNQASSLWDYLEHVLEKTQTFDKSKFGINDVSIILEKLIPPMRDAIAECAKVLGQILNTDNSKTSHELLFFIVAYFNEMAIVKPKDVVTFATKSGVDLAKCVDTFKPQYMDVSRIKTPIDKPIWNIIEWLKGMLRSNHLFVHDVFSTLLATTMQTLSFKIHGLCNAFLSDFKEPSVSFEKTKEVATKLSTQKGVPETNQKRLQEALKQAEILEKSVSIGTIDIWTVAAIMRQMYYEEPIDEKTANTLVYQRTGKTLEDYFNQLDLTFSLIKTEIWLAIIAYGSSQPSKETIMDYIVQYTSIGMRGSWWWRKGDKDEDKEKKKDDEKGKEEATREDLNREARRKARQREEAEIAHMEHLLKLKKERESALEEAIRADPDSPYNRELTNEFTIEQTRQRVKRRLADAQERVADELMILVQAKKIVNNSNIITRINAGNTAIEEFKGSPEHRLTITEALTVVDQLLTENEETINERLRPLRFELDIYQAILDTLDRKVENLNTKIFRTSIRLGAVLLVIAGVFYILYFIRTSDVAWQKEVFTTLDNMKRTAEKTYTRGLVRMWENIWETSYQKARDASLLGQYKPLSWIPEFNLNPDTLKDVYEQSLRCLSTFTNELPNPINASPENLFQLIDKYINFITPYYQGLIGLKTETLTHINTLKQMGHSVERSVDLQKAESLLQLIQAALEKYDNVLKLHSLKNISYDVIMKSVSLANNAFSEAIQALQVKMMTGAMPESINIYTRVTSRILQLPVTTFHMCHDFLQTVVDKLRGLNPQPLDLTPNQMLKIVGAGRSAEWLENYQNVGKAVIAIGVATAAIPLLALFHVSNYISRLYHTGWDPTKITTQAYFDAVSGLTILAVAVFEVSQRASLGNYTALWSFGLGFATILSFVFPQFGIWPVIVSSIRKRIGAPEIGKKEEEKKLLQPTPNATPDPNQQPRSTPALNMRPTTVNPVIFNIPTQTRREPVILNPQQLLEASNQWLANLQQQQQEEQQVQLLEDEDEDKPQKKIEAFVECRICGNEARFMCSHCYEKSYCDADCAKIDWSSKQNKHLSLPK